MTFDASALDPRIHREVERHPYPLVFATISGAHLYGFPSPDSDWDLRGAHLLPARALLGLDLRDETVEVMADRDGLEMDLVTHDLRKFVKLMLRRNGYVLEQLLSPLVVRTTPLHAELVRLSRGCITRHHVHHYKGFAHTQWELFRKESPRRVKPLLYVYRVLLTGIHLMRTGEVQANLVTLNAEAKLPYIADLVARKTGTREQATLDDGDMALHESEFARLMGELERSAAASALPEEPSARAELERVIVEARMRSIDMRG